MELKELKTKSEAELHRSLAESREKLRDLRFKDASRQLKDVREIREVKKLIAQILTLLHLPKQSSDQ
ncbi:50S ribosomal protein L29 [Candidatus Falkowbacteria bacterium]|nr:50S ribosomal protein L29 [Candidatus Falkowbacteria bacterium]